MTKGEPGGSPFVKQIPCGNDRKKSKSKTTTAIELAVEVSCYLAASSAAAPAFRAAALSVASQVKASPERPKWP
jgi:hypothetical protein